MRNEELITTESLWKKDLQEPHSARILGLIEESVAEAEEIHRSLNPEILQNP